MKYVTQIIALMVILSALIGCTEASVGGNTESTNTTGQSEDIKTTGSQTTSSVGTVEKPTVEETAADYYQSAEYKAKFPVRNDLVWCEYIEDVGYDAEFYPINYYNLFLCEGTQWKEDLLLVDVNMEYYGVSDDSYIIPKTRDSICADYRNYLTDHKFVVEVLVVGLTDEVSDNVYPGDAYNEEVFGITDDESRMAFLKEEENYFESLGYEIVRDHSIYHDIWGDFILIAMNFAELDSLMATQTNSETGYVAFKARLENEMYVLTIPKYSELGMYEEE